MLRGSSSPINAILPEYGVCVLESHHAQDFRMNWTRHPFLKILSVINGEGSIETNESSTRICEGNLTLIPQDEEHRLVDDPKRPLSLHIICVAPSLLNEIERYDQIRFPIGWHIGQTQFTKPLRHQVRKLLAEQANRRKGHVSLLRAKTVELLICFEQQGIPLQNATAVTNSSEQRIQNYLSQLEKEFNLEERLEDTAARLGMSQRSFTTHFRLQAGQSRHQKITELRIAHACRLLSDPKRSVIGIAFECGYGDLSSFYRAFRKSKKRSPSDYRKQQALAGENASA
jgi:AraC-like DNA-binding protein/mannose-6-phosphate isomerase-like protein (cupin superfamily)